MSKGRSRLGAKGEITKGGMIRPDAGWAWINGMVEGEDIRRTRVARRLKISPCGTRWTIMGKDEERAKIQVKGRSRASSGMERIG